MTQTRECTREQNVTVPRMGPEPVGHTHTFKLQNKNQNQIKTKQNKTKQNSDHQV